MTYIHTHTHTYIHTRSGPVSAEICLHLASGRRYSDEQRHKYTHTYIYIHAQIPLVQKYAYIWHLDADIVMDNDIHTYVHTYIHTYRHAQIPSVQQIHTYTHTHTHMHIHDHIPLVQKYTTSLVQKYTTLHRSPRARCKLSAEIRVHSVPGRRCSDGQRYTYIHTHMHTCSDSVSAEICLHLALGRRYSDGQRHM